MTSRSFGRPTDDLAQLRQAVRAHAGRGAEKLRGQGSVARALLVFLKTNKHRQDLPQHHPSLVVPLERPSDDSLEIVATATRALARIYRLGHQYMKAGVMLLDLARNDVGRVVEFGSEQVDVTMTLENYSPVMHMTSQVSGRLAEGRTPIDVLRATLPAGTVSGAPKVRAMEIIDELEPVKRGPYAGVVGYIDFSGNIDTAIAIRTMLVADGVASVQAGAGIVADSVPELEHLECQNKARALLSAIPAARRMTAARRAPSVPDEETRG